MSYEREVEVAIDGLAVFARHGALAEEQALGQRFYLDLRLIPLRDGACDTDDLADAVDYGAVCDRVVELVTGGPYNLIERVAEVVAAALLAEFPVDRVSVRVAKPDAPISHPFDHVAVTVTLPEGAFQPYN